MNTDPTYIDRLCVLLKSAYAKGTYGGGPRIGQIIFNATHHYGDLFFISDQKLVDLVEDHLMPESEWLKYDR